MKAFGSVHPELELSQAASVYPPNTKPCCLDDSERLRTIVALGVEVGSGEAVACGAINDLELPIIELAQCQKVLLRLR